MSALFTMDRYYIQTKFVRIFGGAFWFKDANDQVIAYSKQKRFKLKEDIVLYTDEGKRARLVGAKNLITRRSAQLENELKSKIVKSNRFITSHRLQF